MIILIKIKYYHLTINLLALSFSRHNQDGSKTI